MSRRRFALRPRRGFTLAEVMVAVTLLTMGLMSVAGLAATSMRTAFRARDEARYWADAQEIVDSLMARGFANDSTGSATVRGRAISWTVGSGATAPQLVTFVIQRPGYVNRTTNVNDTVSIYLAKMNPGP